MKRWLVLAVFWNVPAWGGEEQPRVGERMVRRGDEIVVCGQLYHTTTKVVLWTDPGGYDAYRVERRFAPRDRAEPKAKEATKRASNAAERGGARYGLRTRGL